jgi:hypothetical protein
MIWKKTTPTRVRDRVRRAKYRASMAASALERIASMSIDAVMDLPARAQIVDMTTQVGVDGGLSRAVSSQWRVQNSAVGLSILQGAKTQPQVHVATVPSAIVLIAGLSMMWMTLNFENCT